MSVNRRSYKFLDEDGTVVKPTPAQEKVIRSRFRGWLLRAGRARYRRNAANKIDQKFTPLIKANWPKGARSGEFKAVGQPTIKAEMRPATTQRVLKPMEFLEALGKHVDDVVSGLKLPSKLILRDIKNLPLLYAVLAEHFPEAGLELDELELLYDRETLKALQEEGSVSLPEGVLGKDLKSLSLYISIKP